MVFVISFIRCKPLAAAKVLISGCVNKQSAVLDVTQLFSLFRSDQWGPIFSTTLILPECEIIRRFLSGAKLQIAKPAKIFNEFKTGDFFLCCLMQCGTKSGKNERRESFYAALVETMNRHRAELVRHSPFLSPNKKPKRPCRVPRLVTALTDESAGNAHS
jgi:hypothetical protein